MSIKSKIAKAAAVVGLVTGSTLVSALPAQAITIDCYPTNCSSDYLSTDIYGGGRVRGDIWWQDKLATGVDVEYDLYDYWSDGRGPIAYIRYRNELTGATETRVRHNTLGTGTHLRGDTNFDRIITGYSAIEIMICNGYGSDGKADYCSGWHGPYHA